MERCLATTSQQASQETRQPDYQAVRKHILESLTKGKGASSKTSVQYKKATQALDMFIEAISSTSTSTPPSTRNGTAAPLVDAANSDIAELQRITSLCGYRLNIDQVTRGANSPIFFVTPPNTMTERIVSTRDIAEIIDWLRRQDLVGEHTNL